MYTLVLVHVISASFDINCLIFACAVELNACNQAASEKITLLEESSEAAAVAAEADLTAVRAELEAAKVCQQPCCLVCRDFAAVARISLVVCLGVFNSTTVNQLDRLWAF